MIEKGLGSKEELWGSEEDFQKTAFELGLERISSRNKVT